MNQSKPFGKPRMIRSQKPNVKEKKTVKKLDEQTVDELTYLGFDFETLTQNIATLNKGAENKN